MNKKISKLISFDLNSFRKNWQVNLFGKWAESNYQSIVYPPFACGTGYILSSDLVDWLCKNLNSLFRYQGEDVSMGIWLASILPNYEHVRDLKKFQIIRSFLF